jgi:hypothetical protein
MNRFIADKTLIPSNSTELNQPPARQTKAKPTKARRFLPCPEKDSLLWIAGFVVLGWLATMAVLVIIAFTVGYFVG